MKRIEACAYNAEEAVLTNVMGSLNVAKAAIDRGVQRCMLISSDKAVAPSTIYGMTKAVAEQVFVNANSYVQLGQPTMLSAVRYGNVLGSRGSVVPIWREQLAKGQAMAITLFDATRFLITQEQAVKFVLSSIELMQGGEVFVPELPTCSVGDLSHAVACVAGVPAQYRVNGLQQNEKQHEMMISPDESPIYQLDDRFQIGGLSVGKSILMPKGFASNRACPLQVGELEELVRAL